MAIHGSVPKVSAAYLYARRVQILEAAKRCFALGGFHATTVEDIRKEAGVSSGLLYRYFDGKEAVVEALLEASDRLIEEQLERTVRVDQEPLEILRGFFDALLEIYDPRSAKTEVRLAVQFWAEASRSNWVQKAAANRLRRFARALAPAIERGQQQGTLRSDLEPIDVAHLVCGGLEVTILRAALFPRKEARAFRNVVRTALFDGILKRNEP